MTWDPETVEPEPVSAARQMLFDEPLGLGDQAPSREEVRGCCELAYRGQACVLFSERGQGKSTVETLLAASAAAQGERVYFWDRENGRGLTGRRVDSIQDAYPGWPDVRECAGGNLVYREYPRLDPSLTPEEMGEALEGFSLVIYDSLREAIAQLGGDPNSDADISRFVTLCVTPIVRQGGSVIMSDNTGHEMTHRPKGSGTKLDAIPQAFKVVTTQKFSEVERGAIEITCTRSRFGDMDRIWSMDVGGGAWGMPTPRSENPDKKIARELANAKAILKRATLKALEETSPLGVKALAEKARHAGLRKRQGVILEWLKELAAAGVLVHSEEGFELPPNHPFGGGTQRGYPKGVPAPTTLGVGGSVPGDTETPAGTAPSGRSPWPSKGAPPTNGHHPWAPQTTPLNDQGEEMAF